MTDTAAMTAGERRDLLQMVRQRASVARALASQRAAELLAKFEINVTTYFSWEDDERWEAAVKAAEEALAQARTAIQQRCSELNIPKRFAPSLHSGYWSRGGDSYMTKSEKAALQKAAQARVEAIRKRAIFEIERASVEMQEKILLPSLTSALALELLQQMPSVTQLMPPVAIEDVQKLIGHHD